MRKRSQTNLSQTTLNPLQRWKKSKSSQALSPLRPGSAGISSNNSAFYNLDLPQDKSQIYNKDTRWYCKDKIDNVFHAPSHLPYSIENHLDQGQYLYHVVMNLYVSIASLDIRGLIPLSPNELNQLITNLSTENNASQSLDEDDVIDDEDVNQELEEIDDEEIQIDENQASEELTTGPNYNIMGKITSKSSTIINVNHWTHELKNCLSFPLPLSLRKSLVTVYYYLALTQGQRIYRQLYVEMLESLIDPNDHGNNFTKLLRDQVNLRLDHKPLFQFISEFLPYPDPDYVRYDIQSKDDLQLYRLLLKLSHISRPFFDKDENILNDCMNTLLSSLSPSTMSIVLPMMTSFLPFHFDKNNDITHYFPFCFSVWTSVSPNVAVDTHMYDFVGSIADNFHSQYILSVPDKPDNLSKFNEFGLFTKEQLIFLFNRIQGHLRSDGQIHSYSRTVKPFIYSINGSDHEFYFQCLVNLVNSIETFVHPSNNGFWTKCIAKFIHGYIKMYHKRYMNEKDSKDSKSPLFLNDECNEKLVQIMLKVLMIGSQNKNSDIANYYISSLAYLLDLEPRNAFLIFDKVLVDTYDSLAEEFINSRHRIIASLKQFTRIVRYMVSDKIYRIHIIHILSILIQKIDMNDMNLTSNLINGIVSIATFVPLECPITSEEYINFASNTAPLIEQHFMFLKNGGKTSDFEYDDKVLMDAFRASTTIINDSLKMYIDKIFQMVDVEGEEGLLTKINQTTMIMIESMDDKCFQFFAKHFQRKFWDNDSFTEKEPNFEIISTPMAALVKRDNSLSHDIIITLMFNIKQQIERGAGSVRSTSEIQSRDIKLVLYLNSMNDVLRQSHEAVLPLKDELLKFMKFIYKKITNPPLDIITSIMIHTILSTLTTTEVVECRLFPSDTKIPYEERWGGLQFDDRKYDKENLNFKWHIPNDEEVKIAIEIFDNMAQWCMASITELLKSSQSDTLHCDTIQKFILIITHALSGISLLCDPDFTENKLKITELNPNISDTSKALILENFNTIKWDEEDSIDNNDTRENSPGLKIKDINVATTPDIKDILIFDGDNIAGDTASEMPSGISTPVPMDNSRESSVGVTGSSLAPEFRELDIFTCNYYFGNTFEEKVQNKPYFEVHKMRLSVGTFLHKVYEFVRECHENNTIMNQILLHGIKVFFSDVGQETIFNDDTNAFLEGEFLDNIQSLAHIKEPFTRTFFAVKVHELHQNRVLLHSSNRYPSKIETRLLKDMVALSTSLYADVHTIAQGTLTHCMKQIIGSYPMIIRTLINLLKENLKTNEHKKLEVILKVLILKKIHRKLMSDFKNMQTVVLLLIECLKVNDLNVSILAEKVLNDYVIGMKFPSSVCIYDEKMFTPIAPPDKEITNQVKGLRALKENKRKYYAFLIQTLKDSLLKILDESNENSWRLVMMIIRFIARIEANLEITSDAKSISTLFAQTQSKHPDILHLVARSFFSIFNKIFSLSDYKYDITRGYQSQFDPDYVKQIDTNVDGFNELFRNEMNNADSPNYFIDTQPFVGWLCWGKPMKVLTNQTLELTLESNETEIMKTLGSLISKEWLHEFTTTLIQDNESRTVFSTGDVSFFVLMMVLFTKKYTTNITLQDIFDLCEKHYDKYDKASMIMSIEIFAALISGGKYLTSEELKQRDEFASTYLDKCMNHELNQDSFEIWSTFCWWLPTLVDVRRCKPLLKVFGNIKELFDMDHDTVAHQASRILMFRNMLSGIGFRTPDVTEVLENIKFDYPHDQIREAIAKLFATLTQNESTPTINNAQILMKKEQEFDDGKGLGLPMKWVSERLDKMIKKQFQDIEEEYSKLGDMSPQEILKSRYFYLTSTMFYWIEEMATGPNKILIIPYMAKYILPFLMRLLLQKDVCKMAGIDATTLYLASAYIPSRDDAINETINLMCNPNGFNVNPSSYQLKLQIAFVQHYLSSQLLQLTLEQKQNISDFIVANIYNKQYVEVRDRAADVLSDIVHNIDNEEELQRLINQFATKLDGYTWEEKQKLSKTDTVIHGSVIGLGSIISAFPYVFPLPRWIPQELSRLSTWARTSGVAGVSAKNTIAEFKKVRTDTWYFDRTQFTNEELEDLEGVLWRSYYA